MPHPWSIHMKITQIAKYVVLSVDVPFFRVSACRENTYSLKTKKITAFSIALFGLKSSQADLLCMLSCHPVSESA